MLMKIFMPDLAGGAKDEDALSARTVRQEGTQYTYMSPRLAQDDRLINPGRGMAVPNALPGLPTDDRRRPGRCTMRAMAMAAMLWHDLSRGERAPTP